ncbi:MAG TPA: hypothetical protein VNP91_01620, partial [Methylomirabilota bacterium]|nr:hypothetical protein [Methylomirabilota bacterium]
MKTAAAFAISVLSLVSLGCATVSGPDDGPPALVAGEWLGNATVGPTIGCCKGAAGPVRLLLEQKGGVVTGTLVGTGYRGRVGGRATATELTGSCDCQSSNLMQNLQIEGAISGSDMVFRLGDSR